MRDERRSTMIDTTMIDDEKMKARLPLRYGGGGRERRPHVHARRLGHDAFPHS